MAATEVSVALEELREALRKVTTQIGDVLQVTWSTAEGLKIQTNSILPAWADITYTAIPNGVYPARARCEVNGVEIAAQLSREELLQHFGIVDLPTEGRDTDECED